MIEQLREHIREQDIIEIVNIIQNQYRKYIRLTNTPQFMQIFSEEYMPHKRQHNISWAISSAFPSGTTVGELNITCLNYGKGHTRPVLSNDRIELHVLNSTTDFTARYLKDRYQYNANDFSKNKLFCYIKFHVVNERLKEVLLCLPNENGEVTYSEFLLTRQDLMLIA